MLTELQQLHANILVHLDELDALTALSKTPLDRLPAARLALTRASRARIAFLENVYGRLIAIAPHRCAAIEALRRDGKDNLIASVQHIQRWNIREISERWDDYRAASSAMRLAMRQRIRQESALVYPLLFELSVSVAAA